jgi:hypothetical protein
MCCFICFTNYAGVLGMLYRIIRHAKKYRLGQGLKKSPIGKKLDFANHPYLCKGLIKPLKRSPSFLDLILYFLGQENLFERISIY